MCKHGREAKIADCAASEALRYVKHCKVDDGESSERTVSGHCNLMPKESKICSYQGQDSSETPWTALRSSQVVFGMMICLILLFT